MHIYLAIKGIVRPFEFFLNFNCKVSREGQKTIHSGLSISGMALPNQSVLSAFFSPLKFNLKIGLIPEDVLLRMAQDRKITYREWPKSCMEDD
jgi:hypothetical protein